MKCTKQSKCRVCYSKKLKQIISFGKVPLNGNLINSKKLNIPIYNLNLLMCLKCYHIQIGYLVDPKKLFSKYFWETGVSKSNLKIIENLLSILKKKYKLNKNTKVFEVACNDASLLKHFYTKTKCYVSGMDPAKNLLKNYIKRKYRITNDFFNSKNASKYYDDKKFDFIIARNVLAHVEDPNEIIRGAEKISKEGSILVIEVPHLLTIYDENQYDNIFHEHVGYHSLHSVNQLAEKFNFKIFDCEVIESQGKSIRCFYKYTSKQLKKTLKVKNILNAEKKLLNKKIWLRFSSKIRKHKSHMQGLFSKLKNTNKSISAYGASGKGQSLLQICKLNENYIDFIFDKSPLKINKYSPYGKIKIVNQKKINEIKPDYLLLLTWNLKNEIISQEKEYTSKGGKFIIPFPYPTII